MGSAGPATSTLSPLLPARATRAGRGALSRPARCSAAGRRPASGSAGSPSAAWRPVLARRRGHGAASRAAPTRCEERTKEPSRPRLRGVPRTSSPACRDLDLAGGLQAQRSEHVRRLEQPSACSPTPLSSVLARPRSCSRRAPSSTSTTVARPGSRGSGTRTALHAPRAPVAVEPDANDVLDSSRLGRSGRAVEHHAARAAGVCSRFSRSIASRAAGVLPSRSVRRTVRQRSPAP